MKNYVLGMISVLMLGLFTACASAPTRENPYKPLSGSPNANVVGTVQTNFESIYIVDPAFIKYLNEAAYIALLETARKEYSGDIDIVDIFWVFVNQANKKFNYSATGKVVSFGGNSKSTATGVEGALERAADELSENFTAKSRLAIVYITAQDRSTTEFITGELEHLLRRQSFVIIDRSELDKIRREQNFQMSGEVDDETAVSIGKFAGANIIITGRVDGEGNLRRLRLRALDTTSAQVVGTASERL
jgi:hypothetical protein